MKDSINESRSFYTDYFAENEDLSYDNTQRYNIVYSLIEEVPLPPSADVLDVGAGSGRITNFLVEKFNNTHSVDIIQSALLEEVLSDSDIGFVEGALPFLPYQSKSFDMVVCSEVIEHIPSRPEQVAALKDLARVLIPGGWLVLSTPNPRSPHHMFREAVLRTAESISHYEREGGQIVENWIPPNELAGYISSYLQLQERRGSYYTLPGFGTGIERLFYPLSDVITSRNLLSHWGLYQYYLAQK